MKFLTWPKKAWNRRMGIISRNVWVSKETALDESRQAADVIIAMHRNYLTVDNLENKVKGIKNSGTA